jgi:hypothetical protein
MKQLTMNNEEQNKLSDRVLFCKLSMSGPLAEVRDKIETSYVSLQNEVIKVYLFGNTTGDLHHWSEELASYQPKVFGKLRR